MTCPTCKNKILDSYELNGVEYCCPNCAYNRGVLKQIIENKRLSSKILFKNENKTN